MIDNYCNDIKKYDSVNI